MNTQQQESQNQVQGSPSVPSVTGQSPPIPPQQPPVNNPPPINPPPPPPYQIPNTKFQIPSVSRFAPLLLLPLILSTFALSYFFFSKQPQPKTGSRASYSISPTSPISLISSISPIPTTPSATSSSFSKLITSPTSSLLPSPSPAEVPLNGTKAGRSPRISFDLTANENTFSPSQLTAYKDQIITVNITAVDKAYDFSLAGLGLSQTIPKGEKKTIEFQATSFGQYIFSCDKNCGGSFTARGLLTIKP